MIDKKEINILIDDLNNIALFNEKNYIVLNACKDALRLAFDLLDGKSTDNYLLKITTHQGKMQGINSLSTYKKVCDTCNALKDNKNAICYKCYADKTLAMYKQLAPVLIYNTLLLKYTDLKRRQLPVINASYFRFEAFSDLQNAQHLKNLYKIARYNPRCRFALWTKNIKLILTEKTPHNCNLIISSPLLNTPLCVFDKLYKKINEKTGAKSVKVFTVYDKKHIKDAVQNCEQKCINCLKCYKAKDKNVFINEKLK